MIFIYPIRAFGFQAFFGVTDIHMNFGTRTTRALVTHFPKVIFFIAIQNLGFRKFFRPNVQSFLIAFEALFSIAFKNCNIDLVFVNTQFFHQKLVGPFNGFAFKIIAKTPISEHFKHGMVVGITPHFFEVVVFTRNAQALLRISNSSGRSRLISQENILKLIHTRIGKHQSRIIFYHHGSTWNNGMFFLLKKIEESLTNKG